MIKIFKGKKSDVLSSLTLNDVLFWSGDYFVAVVFALYVTEMLGGTAGDVGVLFGMYFITRSITAIPVGKYFDNHKGHIDEYIALTISTAAAGLLYMSLSFAENLWFAYATMVCVAIAHTITNLAWKVLFYSNVPQKSEGKILSVYESLSQLTWGLAVIISGFVADNFGYDWAIFFGGLISLMSSLVIIMMYHARRTF